MGWFMSRPGLPDGGVYGMRWIIESVTPARRRARPWIRQANAARDRQDWPAAREAYGRALQEYPPMPPIWVQYGHAAKESGDLPAAEAAYRRALDLRPGFADGHLQLGHALKRQGQTAAALESYLRAAGFAAEDPEYQMQLGHALNGMGRRVAAVEAFRRALSLAPGRADAALELGHALLALGEPVGALEAFRQAVRLAPEQPAGTWMQHGHAARAAEELAAAEAAYRRALELAPDQADSHLHLGHVLRESRQGAAALAAYGRAAELAPEDALTQRLLGDMLREAGRPEAAAAAFARVVALAPDDGAAHLRLAEVLAGLGRAEAALAACDRALALAPGDAAVQALRASVFRALPSLGVPQGVSLAAVRWAMRFFIGREPARLEEAELHRTHASLDSLRRAFASTPEFAAFYRALTQPRYAVPLFLLAPPASPLVPWCFEPPRLSRLSSQVCTLGQLEEPGYASWCGRFALEPAQHRKPWEFCYIGAALESAGLLQAGSRGLGFGCGREPLPSYFAARGVTVLATDAPADVVAGQGRHAAEDHAAGLEAVYRPALVAEAEFQHLVDFRAVDMTRIPAGLAGFDFCWSAGALGHLGSLQAGIEFVIASLGTLRPGGIAVHTMEFNLSSDAETLETPGLSVYRRQDIETLIAGLTAAGHEVARLNTHTGDRDMDDYIDLPPYALPHVKLQIDRHTVTSLGLIIRRGEAG